MEPPQTIVFDFCHALNALDALLLQLLVHNPGTGRVFGFRSRTRIKLLFALRHAVAAAIGLGG
jgi:hypothetical protein